MFDDQKLKMVSKIALVQGRPVTNWEKTSIYRDLFSLLLLYTSIHYGNKMLISALLERISHTLVNRTT